MVDTQGIFRDLVFEFAIEGIPPLKLKKLRTEIQEQGGKSYLPGEAELAECSHVVASNKAHPAAVRAKDRGKSLVSLLWLVDSLKAKRPLPHTTEPLYQPARAGGIPGAESCSVSITNLSDSLRYAVLDMLNGMGVKLCLAMQPDMTTHIVAKDVDDPNSDKLRAARAARAKIRIVNVLWVYDCSRQRQILPAESYTSNPAPEMDPTQGKLAIEIWPQTIAATPESTPSPSAFGLEEGGQGALVTDPVPCDLLPQRLESGLDGVAEEPQRLESGLDEVAQECPAPRDSLQVQQAAVAALQHSTPCEAVQNWLERQEPWGEMDGGSRGHDSGNTDVHESAGRLRGAPTPATGPATGPKTKSSKLRPEEATPAVLTESASRRKLPRGQTQPPETAEAGSVRPVESRPASCAGNAGRDVLQENQVQPDTVAKATASGGWRSRWTRTPLTGVVPNLVQAETTSMRTADPATAQRGAGASERVAVSPEAEEGVSEARQVGRTSGGRVIRSACQWESYEGEDADAPQQSGNDLSGTMDNQERTGVLTTELGNSEAGGNAEKEPKLHQEAAWPSLLHGKALIDSLHLDMQHDFESSSVDCSEVAAAAAMAGAPAAQFNPSGLQGEPMLLDDQACALSQPAEPGNPPSAGEVLHRTEKPGTSGLRAAKAAPPISKLQQGAEQAGQQGGATGVQTLNPNGAAGHAATAGTAEGPLRDAQHAAQPEHQASAVPGAPEAGTGATDAPMGRAANGAVAALEPGASARVPADQSKKGVANSVLWKAQPLRKAGGSSAKASSRRQVPWRSGTQIDWRPLIGRRVSKLFDGVAYEGEVVRFNAKSKYFHITYDDDDSKDFSYKDLCSHLLPEGSQDEEPEVSSPPKAPAEVVQFAAAEQPVPDPATSLGKRQSEVPLDPLVSKRRKHFGVRKQGDEQAPAAIALPQAAEGRQADEAGIADQQEVGRKQGGKAAKKRASRVTAARSSAPAPGNDTKPPPAAKAMQRGVSRGGTPRSGAKPSNPRRALFAVSGMHRDEREQAADKMRALGLNMTADLESHKWDPRTTHLVMPCMLRCGKTLAAMAAGAWLLSDSYLVASFKARSLLEPEEYEMDVGSKDVSQGAPKHWRARSQLLGKRAFAGLRVLVHDPAAPGDRPSRDDILAIVKAGGGSIVTAKQALSNGADLCVTRRPKSDSTVKQLLRAGVCIARPLFLVEWLAHPWLPLSQHLLYRSRMGGRLSAAVDERGDEEECAGPPAKQSE